MEQGRPLWRALRPVLLATAAAIMWLIFASPAASADAPSGPPPLTAGMTSAVTQTPGQLPLISDLENWAPDGLLAPIAGQAAGLLDATVAPIPSIGPAAPAGTVSAVTAPLATIVDEASAGVVQVVAQPVAWIRPVLPPILPQAPEPVSPARPLPDSSTSIPVPADETPARSLSEENAVNPDTALNDTLAGQEVHVDRPDQPAVSARASMPAMDTPAPAGGTFQFAPAVAGAAPFSGIGLPEPAARPHTPVPAPFGQSLGTGSSAHSSGSFGFKAWLSLDQLPFPSLGAVHAAEKAFHAPAPRAFDPASTPD